MIKTRLPFNVAEGTTFLAGTSATSTASLKHDVIFTHSVASEQIQVSVSSHSEITVTPASSHSTAAESIVGNNPYSTVGSSTDYQPSYRFSVTDICFVVVYSLKRAIKHVGSVLQNIFGGGYWVDQFARISFIKQQPRILRH